MKCIKKSTDLRVQLDKKKRNKSPANLPPEKLQIEAQVHSQFEREDVNDQSEEVIEEIDSEITFRPPDGIQLGVDAQEEQSLGDDLLDYDDELSDTNSIEPLEENENQIEQPNLTQIRESNRHVKSTVVVANRMVENEDRFSDLTAADVCNNPALMKIMEEIMEERNGNKRESINQGNETLKQFSPKLHGVKSPSDTTIYVPALKQIRSPNNAMLRNDTISEKIDQISAFIEGVQVDAGRNRNKVQTQQHEQTQAGTSRGGVRNYQDKNSQSPCQLLDCAGECANQMILAAERNKAERELPRGMLDQLESIPPQVEVLEKGNPPCKNEISDDEFFHLTCHVDQNLKKRIELGEFVELEKLLVKNRFSHGGSMKGQKLQLVSKEDGTFIVPADRENKISNVRRWEQAFRVYAAIYSNTNSHRSAEILQYIFVINSAASTYLWDNVTNYDYTFRQLMACNPQRSWAKIYLQMWNLTMRDPISRGGSFGGGEARNNAHNNHSRGSGVFLQPGGGGSKKKKSDYCWAFNKGIKCKFGSSCRYIERCSYCDSGAHAVLTLFPP